MMSEDGHLPQGRTNTMFLRESKLFNIFAKIPCPKYRDIYCKNALTCDPTQQLLRIVRFTMESSYQLALANTARAVYCKL